LINNNDISLLLNSVTKFVVRPHEKDFRVKGKAFDHYHEAEEHGKTNKKYKGYYNIFVRENGVETKIFCSYEEEKEEYKKQKKEKKISSTYDHKPAIKKIVEILSEGISDINELNKIKFVNCSDIFPLNGVILLREVTPEQIDKLKISKVTSMFFYKIEGQMYNGKSGSYRCYLKDEYRKNGRGERAVTIGDL